MNNDTNQSGFIPGVAWLRRDAGQWLRAEVTAAAAMLLLLVPLVALVPLCVLAAGVVACSAGLTRPAGFRENLLVRPTELWWASEISGPGNA